MSQQPVDITTKLTWTFGDRVRKIRRASGLSQGDLAALIGTKPNTIANWESTGSGRGEVAFAKRIELALGVPAAWTLGLTDDPRPSGGPDGGDGYTARDSNPEPADSHEARVYDFPARKGVSQAPIRPTVAPREAI